MKLSENFSLKEMIFSDEAVRRGIDNIPGKSSIDNLERLCKSLEQIRALLCKPISISSGYRCEELNSAIGGSNNSAHCKGLAADLKVKNLTPIEVCRAIERSNIEFDQLIFEGAWTHFALSSGSPRREVLTAVFKKGEKTTYLKGLQNVGKT